ncbi:MAG TPA: hypothetical protein VHF47_06920 [Acidimicrobiales bacterium]|nr:hypothetical protein [Acidimicrobiales bacterium]
MHEAPHAPWSLRGEVVVAWARRAAGAPALPDGLHLLPGPALVFGVRYTDSPVGPFCELAVGLPARLGLRPGFCLVEHVVSEPAAKVGLRCNWGFPADVGRLTWVADAEQRVLRYEDRGLVLRMAAIGPRLPVLVGMRSVQRRGDGPVLVPRRLTASARFARGVVDVPADDSLAWLGGSHGGLVLSAARLVVRPARHPLGLLSSFRAPLRAAEPGLSYRGSTRTAARSSATAEALQ